MEHFESKIVSVKVFGKSICHYVTYKKERKRLFGLISSLPAGYYTDGGRYLGNEEDLLNGSYTIKSIGDEEHYTFILICENKKAYYRPYVKIKFESGNIEYKYFNTVGECNFYARNLKEKWANLLLIDVNKL